MSVEAGSGAATGWVEGAAARLLDAFYDLSGGGLTVAVSIGGSDTREGAARRAGLAPDSTECGVALRFLLNQGYVKRAGSPASGYEITVAGMDRARQARGLDAGVGGEGESAMSDKMQKRLVTLLSIAIAMGLSQPVSNFIREQIPERRGVRDDLAEAVLEGIVRTTAFFLASFIVRQIAGRR